MREERVMNFETERGTVQPMGVSFDGKDTNVAISVSDGQRAFVLLYEKGKQEPIASLAFKKEDGFGQVQTMKIKGLDIRKYAYNFMVDDKVQQDPYARVLYGREKFGTRKEGQIVQCGYVDLVDVLEDRIERPFDECVGYHMHVRGFTAKAQVKNKGTFAGLVEKIPYLQDLGVNMIQLMPCYEFDETNTENPKEKNPFIMEEKQQTKVNFWGYGTGNYFAPKGAYAVSDCPSEEFLNFIQAYHKAGIEVIMEVYFSDATNFRFMEEVLWFWTIKYGVDGFFVHCREDARYYLTGQPLFGKSKLLFSDYTSNIPYYEKLEKSQNWKMVGVANQGFQSDMRCFLKGDFGKSGQAFYRMKANEIDYAIVNYIASHNGFTLADLVSYDYKHNEDNGEDNRDGSFENYSWNCGVEGKTRKKKVLSLRLQMMKNAFVLLLLSQGTPMIYGGDELANSQDGNNNAYCQDNEIGWTNWNVPKAYEELGEFVKQLIQFRKDNKVFHQKLPLRMMDTLSCGYPDVSCHGETPWLEDFSKERQAIGLVYCGNYVDDPEQTYYVAYNMYWEEREFALPKTLKNRKWYRKIDTAKDITEAILPADKEILLEEQSMVTVAPRSIQVFHAK